MQPSTQPKLFSLSDHGVPSGFGRIADEIALRLQQRGWQIHAASVAYDGLLPPQYNGQPLPFHVAPLNRAGDWVSQVTAMIAAIEPDVILVGQDFPFSQMLRAANIDWSHYGFVVLTPVDGAPIFQPWVEVMQQADAGLTISQFGVDAFAEQGCQVTLCRPGVDGNTFYKMRDEERLALRAKLGLGAEHFIVGTMAQNQGRKSYGAMLRAFFEVAKRHPNARYLIDTSPTSPAGWDIPALCQMYGWDRSKLIFAHEAQAAGLMHLRERYNVLDAHMVISHREGYGLPLAEAMACGVPSIALDYCSGTEICGEGRGVLVKCSETWDISTWGGAKDKFADQADLVTQLERLIKEPGMRSLIAEKGMQWSRQQTWDQAADAAQGVLEKVYQTVQYRRRVAKQPKPEPPPSPEYYDKPFPLPGSLVVAPGLMASDAAPEFQHTAPQHAAAPPEDDEDKPPTVSIELKEQDAPIAHSNGSVTPPPEVLL